LCGNSLGASGNIGDNLDMKVHLSTVANAALVATVMAAVGWALVRDVNRSAPEQPPLESERFGPGPDTDGSIDLSASTPVAIKSSVSSPKLSAADVVEGRTQYLQSCATCHGQQGQGMPHQAPDLRGSGFIARRTDQQLAAFIKAGRLPNDPQSVMRLYMPPLGGNLALKDQDVAQIIAYLRTLQAEAGRVADSRRTGVEPGMVFPAR
jgi:disulfide bond formation protein DsbB